MPPDTAGTDRETGTRRPHQRRPRRPHLTRMRSLWRMKSYLRPYATRLTVIWVTSFAGIGIGIAIPLVGREIIDGPVARDDTGALLPRTARPRPGRDRGTARPGAPVAAGRRRAGVETALRDDLYRHLQRLPMSFHGAWQSGQLLSRVTTDLSVIRRFLGFGMLFLVLITVQIAVVTALLFQLYWPLGLLVAASAVPIVTVSMRFERGYIAISRQVQDEQGDLATVVEESAGGIRTIKAFGRGGTSSRPSTTERARSTGARWRRWGSRPGSSPSWRSSRTSPSPPCCCWARSRSARDRCRWARWWPSPR
nr:hypothetical protein GCM10020093_013120 [Planobispora longispora]